MIKYTILDTRKFHDSNVNTLPVANTCASPPCSEDPKKFHLGSFGGIKGHEAHLFVCRSGYSIYWTRDFAIVPEGKCRFATLRA